nr:MAG TPA: hypothetical protein [Caudoviricetes sp.]
MPVGRITKSSEICKRHSQLWVSFAFVKRGDAALKR